MSVPNKDGKNHMESISNIEVPLVYTEFKTSMTPDKSPKINHSSQLNSPGLNKNKSKNSNVINRHSFISYLESMNTTMIWLILLMPIVILLMFNISMKTSLLADQYNKIPIQHVNIDETSMYLSFQIQNISYTRYIQSYITIHPQFINTDCDQQILNSGSNNHQAICYLSKWNNVNIEIYLQQNQLSLDKNHNNNRYRILNFTYDLNEILRDYYNNVNISSISIPIPSIDLDISNALLYNSLRNQTNNSFDSSTILSNYQLIYFIQLYSTRSIESNPILSNILINKNNDNNIIELIISKQTKYSIKSVCIIKVIVSISIFIWLIFILQIILTHAYQLQKKLVSTQQLPQLLESEHLLSTHSNNHVNNNDNNNNYNSYKNDNEEIISIWHLILPEQYLSILFLLFILLWINPIEAIYILFSHYNNNNLIILTEKISIIFNFIRSFSLFGLYYCILVYIDGLCYSNNALNNDDIKTIRLHQIKKIFTNSNKYKSSKTPDELFLHHQLNNNNNNNKSTNNNNNSNEYKYWRRKSYSNDNDIDDIERKIILKSYNNHPIKEAKTLYVTYHHPLSRDYLDFIVNKLVLLLVTWLVVGIYYVYL